METLLPLLILLLLLYYNYYITFNGSHILMTSPTINLCLQNWVAMGTSGYAEAPSAAHSWGLGKWQIYHLSTPVEQSHLVCLLASVNSLSSPISLSLSIPSFTIYYRLCIIFTSVYATVYSLLLWFILAAYLYKFSC